MSSQCASPTTENMLSKPDLIYWETLFHKYSNNFLDSCLEKILNLQPDIYIEIAKSFADMYGEEVNVIKLWIEKYSLPPIFPDGTRIPTDLAPLEIIHIMHMLNPLWLLEITAFSLSESPSTDTLPTQCRYNIDEAEFLKIEKHLMSIFHQISRKETENMHQVNHLIQDVNIQNRNILVASINRNLKSGVYKVTSEAVPVNPSDSV